MQTKGNVSPVRMGGWPSQASKRNSMEMPWKENKSTVWQIYTTSQYLSRRFQVSISQRHLYISIYCRTTYNCRVTEPTQTPSNKKWVKKDIYIFSARAKDELKSLQENGYAWWSVSEGEILHLPTYLYMPCLADIQGHVCT